MVGPACGVLGEDGGDLLGNVAHGGVAQLDGIETQLAGLVAVDGFEGQREISAVLGEAGGLGIVTDCQLGVLAPALRRRAGEPMVPTRVPVMSVQVVEVLDLDDLLPPVVAGLAHGLERVDDDLVEGVLHQAGEIGGGGELGADGVEAAMQVVVAGEHQVGFTDAGQAGDLESCPCRHPGLRRADRRRQPGAGLRC